jgi:hypothetical protein
MGERGGRKRKGNGDGGKARWDGTRRDETPAVVQDGDS